MPSYTVKIGPLAQVVSWDTDDMDEVLYPDDSGDALLGTFYGIETTARIKSLGIDVSGADGDDPILLENNVPIKWKTSAGAKRTMLKLNDNDIFIIGNDSVDGANSLRFDIEGIDNAMRLDDVDGLVFDDDTSFIRLKHGSGPATPANGHIWTENTGLFVHVSGVTVGPLGTGSSGGAGETTVLDAQASITIGNVGSGEDDLMTYTLAAGKLAADGDSVLVEMLFNIAPSVTNARCKAYFGSNNVYDSGNFTSGVLGEIIHLSFRVYRQSSTTQYAYGRAFAVVSTSTAINKSIFAAPTETLSGTVVIKGTGESGDAGDDDVRQFNMVVSYWDKP